MTTPEDDPQLLWANQSGLDDVSLTTEEFSGGRHAPDAPTLYESIVAAPADFVYPPPPQIEPRAPPPLPPRDPHNPNIIDDTKESKVEKTIRTATAFVTDATSLLSRKVTQTVSKMNEKKDGRAVEAQAFNREVLARIPDSFTHRNLNASSRSRIRMITVEQFKQSPIDTLTAKMASLNPPPQNAYSQPPSTDPTGNLFFVNVDQIACLVHKVIPSTTGTPQTLVVLRKDIPSSPNTLLRVPPSVESFDSLSIRLPSSFVILPLVTDWERHDRRSGITSHAQGEARSQIAVNADCVISVSPFDLEWTNIVVVGSVSKRVDNTSNSNKEAVEGGEQQPPTQSQSVGASVQA
ncbi:hypothetical protein HDU79_002673, partial [Rhizoclosmatium sp. JEL0117]